MHEIKRVGDLDISQDIDHQHRMWRVEHVSWAIMALIVIAALVGLLGPGPLSNATAGPESAPLWASYGRFDRYKSPSEMTIHVSQALSADGKVKISVNRAFFDRVDLEHIDPQPEQVAAGPNWLTFTFALSNEPGMVPIKFSYEPQRAGRLHVAVGTPGGAPIRFTSFVYP